MGEAPFILCCDPGADAWPEPCPEHGEDNRRPVTARPAGGDTREAALREELIAALIAADRWTPDVTLPDEDFWGHYADAVLALDAMRAALAAQEKVRRVRQVYEDAVDHAEQSTQRQFGGRPCRPRIWHEDLRRALDGDR